jgi:hypothetical protein
MTLDEIKQAANRLRKQSPELGLLASSTLTHAQALNIAAKLHGFRHYHEAQKSLAHTAVTPRATSPSPTKQKALEIVAEAGGLVPLGDSPLNSGALTWPTKVEMLVEGPSGCGKSLLVKEFVCLALSEGTQVRILDTEGSYRNFAFAMAGQHFYDSANPGFRDAWASSAPLVMLDATGDNFSWEQLRCLPKSALFVCGELGVLKLEDLGVRTLRVVSSHRAPAMEGVAGVSFERGSRGKWQLRLTGGAKAIPLQYVLSAARNAAYFSR